MEMVNFHCILHILFMVGEGILRLNLKLIRSVTPHPSVTSSRGKFAFRHTRVMVALLLELVSARIMFMNTVSGT